MKKIVFLLLLISSAHSKSINEIRTVIINNNDNWEKSVPASADASTDLSMAGIFDNTTALCNKFYKLTISQYRVNFTIYIRELLELHSKRQNENLTVDQLRLVDNLITVTTQKLGILNKLFTNPLPAPANEKKSRFELLEKCVNKVDKHEYDQSSPRVLDLRTTFEMAEIFSHVHVGGVDTYRLSVEEAKSRAKDSIEGRLEYLGMINGDPTMHYLYADLLGIKSIGKNDVKSSLNRLLGREELVQAPRCETCGGNQ